MLGYSANDGHHTLDDVKAIPLRVEALPNEESLGDILAQRDYLLH